MSINAEMNSCHLTISHLPRAARTKDIYLKSKNRKRKRKKHIVRNDNYLFMARTTQLSGPTKIKNGKCLICIWRTYPDDLEKCFDKISRRQQELTEVLWMVNDNFAEETL